MTQTGRRLLWTFTQRTWDGEIHTQQSIICAAHSRELVQTDGVRAEPADDDIDCVLEHTGRCTPKGAA
jgi:hypothetical protein